MKMISSAKMHRAEADLRRLLPFRQQIETIIGNLMSADADFSSPLTEQRDVKSVGIVVFGSDDGLCGAFNINIFKDALVRINEYRQTYGSEVKIVIIPVGSKVAKALGKIAGGTVSVEPVPDVSSKTAGEAVKNFVQTLEEKFTSGEIDKIDLLYMHFQSVSRQTPRAEQILPVVQSTFTGNGVVTLCRPYIFEPDAATIFVSVLPMFILSVMQEVFTENRASEQAARIMAMQSANDNAKKLLEQLQLEYNKLRQQSITTELLDIIGGQVR